MRILYVGNFGRSWNTEEHLARDAEQLGVEVVRVAEPRTPVEWAPFADDLEAHAQAGLDLVLYTKTHGFPVTAKQGAELWRRLEQYCPTASFHLDLYFGLRRQREIGDDPFWHTGTVFTADGDPAFQQYCAGLGLRHRWLPPAVVSSEAVRVETGPPLERPEVVFVGSTGGYHPEWPWRDQLLRYLKKRYGARFRAIGGRPAPLRGLALNALYQQPGRVVVGDSLCLPGHTRYWSDRYFETVGRGGFLIAPQVEGLEAYLTHGVHFLGYQPGQEDQLGRLVDSALSDPEWARRIADAGQDHVAGQHTYRQRVRQMCSELGLLVP